MSRLLVSRSVLEVKTGGFFSLQPRGEWGIGFSVINKGGGNYYFGGSFFKVGSTCFSPNK